MCFYDFMLDFLGDETPLGDLAAFIKNDTGYPKSLYQPEKILAYFHSMPTADHTFIESVKRAIQLYVRYHINHPEYDIAFGEKKEISDS
ncbi:YozE family protein [Staphylococcus lutrae]|uniref:YozE SAM-like domain-containing protein n=1 Tax=Staphylococcus lutrae TaxID=155085 RepID=A0AAC9RTS2_9STAP|nr:YozE family protein [Staphylococcus lutrae]ARJ50530.1 hypothetical protein B5P37_03985 [Staphylococcus lutrae]PNZ37432.1 hypothetical protein CD134_06540 [Staphylococcus lutrae]